MKIATKLINIIREELENNQINHIYCDLDGVLVNFRKGAINAMLDYRDHEFTKSRYKRGQAGFNELFETHNYNIDLKALPSIVRGYMWYIIKLTDNFWLNLDKMPDADILWDVIKDYKPKILSAPGLSEAAIKEKPIWCLANLDGIDTDDIFIDNNKAKYATVDSILIDDTPKKINNWVAAGGKGILHTSANDTLNQLKEFNL